MKTSYFYLSTNQITFFSKKLLLFKFILSSQKALQNAIMDRGVATYARNARNANETTEWEDALIKKGILQPKTKVEEEEEVEEECHLQEYNSEEDDEYDDDRILAMIRAKRMNEMKNQYARSKFGSILPILKDEWTKEVNEASQETFVVVYVYDSSVHDCKLMDILLRDIAKQKPQVKFVSIPSQQCMANWPAR